MKSSRKFLISIAATIFLQGGIFCQQATEEDEPSWKALQRETVPVPQPYEDKVRSDAGPILELSLNDAIRLALSNNLEIAIENFNEDLNRERIIQTRGFYDPVLQMRLGWNSSTRPSTSILDAGVGIASSVQKTWFLNTSLLQNVPGGGSLQVDFSNDRFTTNSAFFTVNPLFGTDFRVQFRQPLRRGFRETETERQIRLFNLDTQISDSQFKERVSEIIQLVETQYWELVFAIQNYEALRQSVELAIVQFENNKKRARIGVLAPIEITSSRAEVASREQDMVQSEIQVISAENALKDLLAPEPDAPLWNMTILPIDHPEVQDLQISLESAVETALQRRPELQQVRLQMDKTEVDRKYLKNQGKWAVNLVGSVLSIGSAGEVFRVLEAEDTNNDGIPDTEGMRVLIPESPLFGNFSDTFGQVFGFDFVSYNLAVELEIPLRNRTNDAQLAQLALSERQLDHSLKNAKQEIVVEVRNAYQSIETQKKRLEVARLTRELTEDQLQGENRRFEAGLSTNFEVLRWQRDLANAQIRELRALIDLQLAITALQEAMFTIVDENDIVVAREEYN